MISGTHQLIDVVGLQGIKKKKKREKGIQNGRRPVLKWELSRDIEALDGGLKPQR